MGSSFLEEDLKDIKWSDQLARPHDLIGLTCPMYILVENGGDADLGLEKGQIIRIDSWDKQKRIIIKDKRNRYVSVPRDFPMKFLVRNIQESSLKNNRRALKPCPSTKLYHIIKSFFTGKRLEVEFDYFDPWIFRVGGEQTNSRDYGSIYIENLETPNGCFGPLVTEHFLKGFFILKQNTFLNISKFAIIPTTTNIMLKVADGFENDENGLRWRSFCSTHSKTLARTLKSDWFKLPGTLDILLPHISTLTSNSLYTDNDNTVFDENGNNESTLTRNSNYDQKVFNYHETHNYHDRNRQNVHNDEAANELAVLTIESERICVDDTDGRNVGNGQIRKNFQAEIHNTKSSNYKNVVTSSKANGMNSKDVYRPTTDRGVNTEEMANESKMGKIHTSNIVVENRMESATLPRYVQKNNVPPLQTTYATLPKQQVLGIPQQQYQYQSNQYLVQSPAQLTPSPSLNTLYVLKPIQILQNPVQTVQMGPYQSPAPMPIPLSSPNPRENGAETFIQHSTPRVKEIVKKSSGSGTRPRRSEKTRRQLEVKHVKTSSRFDRGKDEVDRPRIIHLSESSSKLARSPPPQPKDELPSPIYDPRHEADIASDRIKKAEERVGKAYKRLDSTGSVRSLRQVMTMKSEKDSDSFVDADDRNIDF
ncbi:DgyrCDS10356 [Dimorphilus gyrociliatus]|uniref:DgyrCDS10356 n=1 Tax=Dimorphilus gyrociliatus TaxID=2664684 RepID=A0A7I8W534_9ANNE|nr:DgyrCDS10356 [Dimorphilus gyrociliatus]